MDERTWKAEYMGEFPVTLHSNDPRVPSPKKRPIHEVEQEYRKNTMQNQLLGALGIAQQGMLGQGLGGSLQSQQYDPFQHVRAQQEAEMRSYELERQITQYRIDAGPGRVLIAGTDTAPPSLRKITNLEWIDQKVNARRVKLS